MFLYRQVLWLLLFLFQSFLLLLLKLIYILTYFLVWTTKHWYKNLNMWCNTSCDRNTIVELNPKILIARAIWSSRCLFYLALNIGEGTNCDPVMHIYNYLFLIRWIRATNYKIGLCLSEVSHVGNPKLLLMNCILL